MDWIILICFNTSLLVHGFSGHIENAPHHALTHGHGNRRARIHSFEPSLESLSAGHGYCAHPFITQMLLHFQGKLGREVLDLKFYRKRVVDRRQCIGKFDVHYRANHLNDFAFIHAYKFLLINFFYSSAAYPIAIAALVISRSSLVIFAWRNLLYSSVRSLISCFALSVAFFMATIRALCSLALDSRRIW